MAGALQWRWPPSRVLLLVCGALLCLLGLPDLVQETAAAEEGDHPGLQLAEAASASGDGCWIFTHLQKCGGSTVKEILKESWGSRYFIYDSMRWKMGEGFLGPFAERLATKKDWNVMTGGYPEALRRSPAVEKNCRWFTMFRHPVARMVSAYYYCRELPGDVACASEIVDAREVDLLAFAKHWGNFALRQFVLSMVSADPVMTYARSEEGRALLPEAIEDVNDVSGWYLLKLYLETQVETRSAELGDVPDAALVEMLRPAQDLLRDGYAAVGILEEFNTTLSLFDAALEMPGVDWHRQFDHDGMSNVDRVYMSEKQRALEDAWTNSEVKQFMQLDLLLYEHAVDIFRRQVELYGLG